MKILCRMFFIFNLYFIIIIFKALSGNPSRVLQQQPSPNPYNSIDEISFSAPTFHGPLPSTSPTNSTSPTPKTVVNLSSVAL